MPQSSGPNKLYWPLRLIADRRIVHVIRIYLHFDAQTLNTTSTFTEQSHWNNAKNQSAAFAPHAMVLHHMAELCVSRAQTICAEVQPDLLLRPFAIRWTTIHTGNFEGNPASLDSPLCARNVGELLETRDPPPIILKWIHGIPHAEWSAHIYLGSPQAFAQPQDSCQHIMLHSPAFPATCLLNGKCQKPHILAYWACTAMKTSTDIPYLEATMRKYSPTETAPPPAPAKLPDVIQKLTDFVTNINTLSRSSTPVNADPIAQLVNEPNNGNAMDVSQPVEQPQPAAGPAFRHVQPQIVPPPTPAVVPITPIQAENNRKMHNNHLFVAFLSDPKQTKAVFARANAPVDSNNFQCAHILDTKTIEGIAGQFDHDKFFDSDIMQEAEIKQARTSTTAFITKKGGLPAGSQAIFDAALRCCDQIREHGPTRSGKKNNLAQALWPLRIIFYDANGQPTSASFPELTRASTHIFKKWSFQATTPYRPPQLPPQVPGAMDVDAAGRQPAPQQDQPVQQGPPANLAVQQAPPPAPQAPPTAPAAVAEVAQQPQQPGQQLEPPAVDVAQQQPPNGQPPLGQLPDIAQDDDAIMHHAPPAAVQPPNLDVHPADIVEQARADSNTEQQEENYDILYAQF